MPNSMKPATAAVLGFGLAVLCGVVWKTVTADAASSKSKQDAPAQGDAAAASATPPAGESISNSSPTSAPLMEPATLSASEAPPPPPVPPVPPVMQKVEGGKDESFIEEIVACISRVCKVYTTLDEHCLDAILYNQLCERVAKDRHATQLVQDLWTASKRGPVSCNDFLHHFLKVKTEYGQERMNDYLKAFESAGGSAADRDSPAKGITVRGGRKGRRSVGGESKAAGAEPGAGITDAQKQDLPSSWLPVLSTRIASIFRRMDLNGDHTIDKEEILSLHGGDRATTDSMFADLDTNGDGEISPQEFVEYFLRVLKRCEDKDKAKSSPMRVNDMGNLEKGSPQMPSKGSGHKSGTSITKGRKMVNKIMSILEQKLTERDDRLHY